MRSSTIAVCLLLGLAVCQAVPASKIIQKKSLTDEVKIEKPDDLKIDDTGDEKDRAKKSTTTFCVEIRPGSPEGVQVPCKQSAEMNEQPPCPSSQNSELPPKPVHEKHPTHSHKPLPEPVHSENLVHPSHDCGPASAPQLVHPVNILPEPQEVLNVMPVAQPCNEPQMVVVPSSPLVLVPEQAAQPCPQHSQPATSLYTECTCRPHAVSYMRSAENWMEPMKMTMKEEPMAMMERMDNPLARTHHKTTIVTPIMYPSTSMAKSPLMVQCNPRVMPLGEMPYAVMRAHSEMDNSKMYPVMGQGRSGTIISLHTGAQPQTTQLYHKTYQPGFHGYVPVHGAPTFPIENYSAQGTPAAPGVYINAYPQMGHGTIETNGYRQGQPDRLMMSPAPMHIMMEQPLKMSAMSSTKEAAAESKDRMNSEMNDMRSSSTSQKVPREVEKDQSIDAIKEELKEEIQRDAASLIGTRKTRSDKTASLKTDIKKNILERKSS